MDKNNRLTSAVVLIVKIDITGVFLAYSNVWHRDSSFFQCCVDVDSCTAKRQLPPNSVKGFGHKGVMDDRGFATGSCGSAV